MTKEKVLMPEKIKGNKENVEKMVKTMNNVVNEKSKIENLKIKIKNLQKRFNYKDKDLNILLNTIENFKDEWVFDIPKNLENKILKSHYSAYQIECIPVKTIRIPRKNVDGPTESIFVQIFYVDANKKEYLMWKNISEILSDNPTLTQESFFQENNALM